VFALVNAGLDLRLTRGHDGEGEHRVQKEAGGGHRGDGHHDGDQDRAAQDMEALAVEDVRLQVERRNPDPHRRKHLDQQEPPVREQQFHPVEQHHEGADDEGKRGERPVRPAEREHGSLDHGFVAVSYGAHECPDLGHHDLAPGAAGDLWADGLPATPMIKQ
jgi:hypothetical protein